MTSTNHPDHDALVEFARDALDAERRERMKAHVDACEQCTSDVESIRTFDRAKRADWSSAPRALLDRVRDVIRRVAPPDAVDGPAAAATLVPADVRDDDSLDPDAGQSMTLSSDDARVALAVYPRDADQRQAIHGRVWLTESAEGPIDLVLVAGEHVVAHASTTDGGGFVIDDVTPPGWTLEIHLPSGTRIDVDEPSA